MRFFVCLFFFFFQFHDVEMENGMKCLMHFAELGFCFLRLDTEDMIEKGGRSVGLNAFNVNFVFSF